MYLFKQSTIEFGEKKFLKRIKKYIVKNNLHIQ